VARDRDTRRDATIAEQVLDTRGATLVDLLDRLLDKGVMAKGDLTLGVAGVDLIYVQLSALLCAADRVMRPAGGAAQRRHRKRRSRA